MLVNKPARVLLLEGSAIFRQLLRQELSRDPQIDLAPHTTQLTQSTTENVDVIVLDVDVPKHLGFLCELSTRNPLPVIAMCSASEAGAQRAMDALDAGAIDIIQKPDAHTPFLRIANTLIQKIKSARHANVSIRAAMHPSSKSALTDSFAVDKVLTIGASIGGVQALTHILQQFPKSAPATLVAQQLPASLTKIFAARLAQRCQVEVREAVNGDLVTPGRVLIAPGGSHMLLRRDEGLLRVQIKDGPELDSHKPSIDVLFNSVAKVAGSNAVGVLLSSDGIDGVAGLKNMRAAGDHTLVQDEQTSISFGTAQEAIRRGAAEKIIPLYDVATELMTLACH